jgi:FKBP-type peptidyl-prolyl cis-trans isomerase (trigger factor)
MPRARILITEDVIGTGIETLKKKYEVLSGRYRQPAETIEKYYQEHKEALESLADQVRSEKVIAFLKQNAKVH